jgi:hypothetical protein
VADANVRGSVPPVVLIVALYGTPTIPLGSAVVVMSRVSTAIVNVCVAVCAGVEESEMFAVNVKLPELEGVPLSIPLLLNAKPGGSVPLVTVAL